MSSVSSSVVADATRRCAHCGHSKVSHYQIYDHGKGTSTQCGTMVDTQTVPYKRCGCTKVCDGYVPQEANAWRCQCGADFLSHYEIKSLVEERLQKTDAVENLYDEMEIAYKVYPAGLLKCCLVTIYNFMVNHPSPWEIPTGSTIKCPHCQATSEGSCIEVVDEKDWYFGPVFKFKWRK